MKSSGYLNNAKGAVAPLVAIMLVVIIACVAVVVDLGHIHNVKIQLQRAVDAAALAAAAQLPDGDLDETAAATAAANIVDGITGLGSDFPAWADADGFEVLAGFWNTENLDKPIINPADPTKDGQRFTAGEAPINAVQVSATRTVDHVFFYFLPSSTVTADAIAIARHSPLTIPIAVVTCIPTGLDEIVTPGESICDLALFDFSGGGGDNAGWTGLTITPANPQSAALLMNPDRQIQALDLFNRILYGTDEGAYGLETAPVKKPSCPIEDNETHFQNIDPVTLTGENPITCGLGGEFTGPSSGDPLAYQPLPRWYNINETASPPIPYIYDIATMKDILSKGSGESIDQYKQRLLDLDNASNNNNFDSYNISYAGINKNIPPEIPTDDGRFGRYITGTNISNVKVDFTQPIKEAGYPEVDLNNGLTNIIDYLMELTINKDGNKYEPYFKPYLRQEYEPFDAVNSASSHGRGSSVLLTLPVIWSKDCEATTFISGYYVGNANFLLTRVWSGINEFYDNGDESVVVSINNSPSGECSSRFVDDDATKLAFFGNRKQDHILPDLTSGALRGINGFENKSFEGVLLDPTKGPEFPIGIRRIQLVE